MIYITIYQYYTYKDLEKENMMVKIKKLKLIDEKFNGWDKRLDVTEEQFLMGRETKESFQNRTQRMREK